MKIVLLGYMGSGKSAVGQRLAEVLNMPFYDLDQEIEKKTKKNISEIFFEKGEIFFRKTEYEVLLDLLEANENYVLALGGGTPCYGNVMQLLKEHKSLTSIYLHTSLQELTDRLFSERKKRPLIAHIDTKELLNDFVRKHIFERSYYYTQAHKKVQADAPVDKIVSEIVLQLV
ncbi:shikimate kinase [Rasiella sp. SM2506]|uniref:shikimate kinase n=1 Tax=Rasiella sp. SM2506 TaxID=3423914 RepID=UPI003D7A9560